jgi:hypothetical protein
MRLEPASTKAAESTFLRREMLAIGRARCKLLPLFLLLGRKKLAVSATTKVEPDPSANSHVPSFRL